MDKTFMKSRPRQQICACALAVVRLSNFWETTDIIIKVAVYKCYAHKSTSWGPALHFMTFK